MFERKKAMKREEEREKERKEESNNKYPQIFVVSQYEIKGAIKEGIMENG